MNINDFDGTIRTDHGTVVCLENPSVLGTIFLRNLSDDAGDVTLYTSPDYQSGSPTWTLRDTVTLQGRIVAKEDIPTQAKYLKISTEVDIEFRLVSFSELNFVAHEDAE